MNEDPQSTGLSGWFPTPDETARMATLVDAMDVASRAMAAVEAGQVLLIAQLVQIANVQHDRERRAAAPGEEDRGWAYRSLAEEIAGVLGCSRRTAQTKMGDAVQLVNDYPATLAGMQSGGVTAVQARVILRHGEALDHDSRAEYEGLILARLAEVPMSTARLAAVCEKIADDLHPVTLEERFETAHASRRVVFERDRDGMGWLHAYIPALVGEAVIDRLRSLATEVRKLDVDRAAATEGGDARPGAAFGLASTQPEHQQQPEPVEGDGRTAPQRQADVLADLLLAGAPTAGPDGVPTGLSGIRANVQITIPARALVRAAAARPAGAGEPGAGAGTGAEIGVGTDVSAGSVPATLPGIGVPPTASGLAVDSVDDPSPPGAPAAASRGTPPASSPADGAWLCGHGAIPIVQAVDIAANAPGWERLFHDADTGALLATDHRLPTIAQRRHLAARDEHCRFPGCRTPLRARTTDADHTLDHHLGGPTCVCNLAFLCESHHTLKHHSAWTVRQKPGGILEWTSPTGRVYPDVPAPAVRFVPAIDIEPPPY